MDASTAGALLERNLQAASAKQVGRRCSTEGVKQALEERVTLNGEKLSTLFYSLRLLPAQWGFWPTQ